MGFDALPSLTEMLSQTATYANPFWYAFKWVIGFSVGITLAGLALNFLMNSFKDIYSDWKENKKIEYDYGLNTKIKNKIRLSKIDDDFE